MNDAALPATLPAASRDAQPARNGARALIDALVEAGVEVVFGYPGGAVLPIYDALHAERRAAARAGPPRAGCRACGGRATPAPPGKPGVVLVTSGPGMSNTTTGLLDALCDSVPVVCISGQVAAPPHRHRRVSGMRCARHLAAGDQVERADARTPTKCRQLVRKAIGVATQGRPGPVLIDFPKDLQLAPVPEPRNLAGAGAVRRHQEARAAPRESAQGRGAASAQRRRPVFYGGGGLINSGPAACEAFTQLVRRDRCALHADPDGARRFPGLRPAVPRHAGHARHAGSKPRHASRRPGDLRGCALRRPRHRPAERFLSARQEDPSRHRSFVDQQAGARRRAAGRRLRRAAVRVAGGARLCAPRMRSRCRTGGATIDAWRAQDCLRFAPRADCILPQQLMHALRPGPRRTRRDRLDRCRPAPDVGGAVSEVRPPAALADLGRCRHHGLRPAGRDRRADRTSATSWSSA